MTRLSRTALLLPTAALYVAILGLIVSSASGTPLASPMAKAPKPTWVNISSSVSTAPAGRAGAGFAWDAADGYGVLFGGIEYNSATNSSGALVNDTWTFNGTWTNITATAGSAPSPRENHAMMVYDAADGYVLLFGGDRDGIGLGDTWTFSGGKWTNITSSLSVSPSARSFAGMTYDPAIGAVVLFGGSPTDLISGFLDDTWEFSHGAWSQIYPSSAPSARRSPQMTYDAATGTVVLMGGLSAVRGHGKGISDTWFFDGTTWTSSAAASPTAQWLGDFVYDASLKVGLLYGGCIKVGCLAADASTFVFEKGAWYNANTLYKLKVSPGARTGASMIYDPWNGDAVLFGGVELPSPGYSSAMADTWVFT